MRTTWIATLSLLGFLAAAAPIHARQEPEYPANDTPADVDGIPANDPDETGVEDFQSDLSDVGGQWADQQEYGPVWVPPVDSGWRPYTNGQWANTEQGFAWISNEPWGWATYHYGRWFYDGSLGWAWVPGSVWAPAWVAWSHGGGYLGWAPLPPSAGFTLRASLDLGGVRLGPKFYTYVQERDILARRISAVIVPTQRNLTIMKATTNVTRYAVVQGRVVNRSIDAQQISRVTGRPVPTVRIASLAANSQSGGRGAFYQPPAIRGAARTRAEFGAALPAQVAARRRAFPQGRLASGSGRPRQTGPGRGTGNRSTNTNDYRPDGNRSRPHTRQPSGNPSSPRSQPSPARPAAPPPRASAPPPRSSAPPPRASSPPAQSSGHKPPR